MTDARNFLINTDYPMDKIVYMTSGSQTIANNTYSGTITIAHGLSFIPLVKMQWSNTSDFTITNEHGDDQYFTNIFTSQIGQAYDAGSTSTNILINLYNTSGSSKTLYYRVYCFAPSDAGDDITASNTASSADKFSISTDYNYMKLFHEGVLTPADMSYTHNLGYIPRALIWQENGGYIDDATYSTEVASSPYGVHINTTQIISLNPYADKIHYRIYIDS